MFPTTIWTTIHQAGQQDAAALARVAEKYRPAVRAFIQRRGFADSEADDICQDVFVRLMSGKVLAAADPARGRFRSLLLAVTRHVMIDRLRRRRREAGLVESLEGIEEPDEPAERDAEFDREFVLHLAQTAMQRLAEQESPYYQVLKDHLAGTAQDRRRLWVARRKLIALIRNEIALTCASHREFEEEVAYLSAFLRPTANSGKKV